jgi:hypothetical protein
MMTRGWHPWVLFLVLGLSPVACLGQEEDPPQTSGTPVDPALTPKPPALKSLSGQVVDSVTGQPIARALVQSGSGNGTLTDHEGRFVLEHASVATAYKPGYFENQPGVAAGADGSWLIRLTPEAILYGTVTDMNFQPVQHVRVQLRQLEVRAGLSYWQETNVTTTNAEGEFRFADLQAGKYSLSTLFLIDGLADASSSLGFVPVAYPAPGSGSDEARPTLTLAPGDHVQANLSPPEERLYPVVGTVHGFSRGAAISVETAEHLPLNPAVRFLPDGRFRLRLPLGSYHLKAQSMEEGRQVAGARDITVGPAGLEGVAIELTPLASIPIEVEFEHTGNTPSANSPPFPNLMLVDQDSESGFGMFAARPVAHENGPYAPQAGDPLVIPDLRPGRYLLQANVPPPWYLASATCGNLDLTRESLVVGEASGNCSLRIVLRDDSATLRWSVAETTKANELNVMAFPLNNLSLNSIGGQFEPGSGSFEGMAPGRYLVIASGHALNFAYRDPQILAKYQAEGQEVTLAAGGEAEIELKLAPWEP